MPRTTFKTVKVAM